MERWRRQYAEDSAVPVSSMIDIVFLLIIFFVVTIDIDREVADQEIVPLRKNGEPGIPSSYAETVKLRFVKPIRLLRYWRAKVLQMFLSMPS